MVDGEYVISVSCFSSGQVQYHSSGRTSWGKFLSCTLNIVVKISFMLILDFSNRWSGGTHIDLRLPHTSFHPKIESGQLCQWIFKYTVLKLPVWYGML